MDHHLAAVSDGIPFDPERLARSFEAVRRASEPFSYPAPGAGISMLVAPIQFAPGPVERLMTPMQVTVANLEASIKASETARVNAVADTKPVAIETPVPEWFFETAAQRRARMIRKFGYGC